VPFFARERSVEKEFDKPLGTAGGETVRRETEDVGVVVLAGETDGARIERDGGADAFDAVSLDGDADSGAAKKNPPGAAGLTDGLSHSESGVVVIIFWVKTVRPEVSELRKSAD